jgi:hypothetical protein
MLKDLGRDIVFLSLSKVFFKPSDKPLASITSWLKWRLTTGIASEMYNIDFAGEPFFMDVP